MQVRKWCTRSNLLIVKFFFSVNGFSSLRSQLNAKLDPNLDAQEDTKNKSHPDRDQKLPE